MKKLHLINFSSGALANILNIGVTLISYPLFLKSLGGEGFGYYIFGLTFSGFFQLTNLGVGPTIIRFASQRIAEGNLALSRRYIATSLGSVIIGLLIVAAICIFFATPIHIFFKISTELAPFPKLTLSLACCAAFLSVVLQAYRSSLMAIGKAYIAHSSDVFSKVTMVLCALIGALVFKRPEVALFGYIFGQFVIVIIVGGLLTKHRVIDFFGLIGFKWAIFRETLPYSASMAGSAIANFFYGPMNRLVITKFIGLEGIPVFDIAFNISMQMRNIFERGLTMLAPEIAKATVVGNTFKLIYHIRKIAFLSFLPICIAWGSVFIFAEPLLRLWLGEQFINGMSTSFRLMLVGSFFSLYGAIGYHILIGLGRSKIVLLSNILQSGICSVGLLLMAIIHSIDSIGLIVLNASFAMVVTGLYLLYHSSIIGMNKESVSRLPL